MNVENIQSYLKECFFEDGIEKKDIIKDETEDVRDDFKKYINQICSTVDFYEYSREIHLKDDDESIDDIKKEMEFENISEEEIKDLNIVYDWFFIDRIRFFLKEDLNFFLDLVS